MRSNKPTSNKLTKEQQFITGYPLNKLTYKLSILLATVNQQNNHHKDSDKKTDEIFKGDFKRTRSANGKRLDFQLWHCTIQELSRNSIGNTLKAVRFIGFTLMYDSGRVFREFPVRDVLFANRECELSALKIQISTDVTSCVRSVRLHWAYNP